MKLHPLDVRLFERDLHDTLRRVAVGGETIIVTSLGTKQLALVPIAAFEGLLAEHAERAREGVAIDRGRLRDRFFAAKATATGGSYRIYAHGTGPGATDGD